MAGGPPAYFWVGAGVGGRLEGCELRLLCRRPAGQGSGQMPSSTGQLGGWSVWLQPRTLQ